MSSEAWQEHPVAAGRLFLIDSLQLPSTAFKVGGTWSGKPTLSALLRSVFFSEWVPFHLWDIPVANDGSLRWRVLTVSPGHWFQMSLPDFSVLFWNGASFGTKHYKRQFSVRETSCPWYTLLQLCSCWSFFSSSITMDIWQALETSGRSLFNLSWNTTSFRVVVLWEGPKHPGIL